MPILPFNGALGGGGAQRTGILQVLKTTPQMGVSGSFNDLIGWDAGGTVHNEYSIDLVTGVVTINTADHYLLNFVIVGESTTENRSELDLKVKLDTGSGFVDIPGCEGFQYGPRQASTTDLSSSYIHAFYQEFNAGDEIKLLHRNLGQAVETISARMTIQRLP